MGGRKAEDFGVNGRPFSLELSIPPLATMVFVPDDAVTV